MVAAKNAMEIFTLLNKSNCRECGEKTCLAFAGAVYTGGRRLRECPHLDASTVAHYSGDTEGWKSPEELQREYVQSLLTEVVKIDFAEAAVRTGGVLKNDQLFIEVLGKPFGLKKDGGFITDLHVNPWVVIPLLDYVLRCRGDAVTGDWIPFREIAGGKEKYALFKKRGEDVLKTLADKYTDFFDDIVHMFDGRQVAEQFAADISVVLYPLPLVPVMICYWSAEDDLGSSLNLFFDRSIDVNLGIDSTFFLGTGLAQMLEKLAGHHGF